MVEANKMNRMDDEPVRIVPTMQEFEALRDRVARTEDAFKMLADALETWSTTWDAFLRYYTMQVTLYNVSNARQSAIIRELAKVVEQDEDALGVRISKSAIELLGDPALPEGMNEPASYKKARNDAVAILKQLTGEADATKG